ncbi:unnamed protein product, partial [Ectocarpus sp. 8 AP-2014]
PAAAAPAAVHTEDSRSKSQQKGASIATTRTTTSSRKGLGLSYDRNNFPPRPILKLICFCSSDKLQLTEASCVNYCCNYIVVCIVRCVHRISDLLFQLVVRLRLTASIFRRV